MCPYPLRRQVLRGDPAGQADAEVAHRERDVLVEPVAAAAQRARKRARTNLDDRSRRNPDRPLARAARRQRGKELAIELHAYESNACSAHRYCAIRQACAMQLHNAWAT